MTTQRLPGLQDGQNGWSIPQASHLLHVQNDRETYRMLFEHAPLHRKGPITNIRLKIVMKRNACQDKPFNHSSFMMILLPVQTQVLASEGLSRYSRAVLDSAASLNLHLRPALAGLPAE